jgi:membrane associated rhomboid family serine protease
MFLHGSFLHIALNMYSLYYVGSILEIQIGRLQFLLLYFASGIAGSAGALVLSPLSPTVGASGAIFGVLGALFILERRGSIATGGQIAGLIVLNLVFTFALAAHISVGGHVGGLIGGIVLMSLFHRLRRSQTLYVVGATAAVIVASVIVAYAKVRHYQ